jgi:nucleoside-diphosphate-sugar epimerase
VNSKSILLTGASGFVGSALLSKLVNGNDKIVATSRSPIREELLRYPNVRWVRADVTTDDLSQAMVGIDTVYHLATYWREEDPDQIDRVNILGTQRVAQAAKVAGVKHFINVSSIAACEKGPSPLDESGGIPVNHYGKSKKIADDFIAEAGLNFTTLRPTALFGEHHLGSVYEFAKAVSKGRFVFFGDGNSRTSVELIETMRLTSRIRWTPQPSTS